MSPTQALDTLTTVLDDGSRALVGGRCDGCATVNFPRAGSCPRCGGRAVSAASLARSGSVWTVTVQRFEPKLPFRAPSKFEPFAVAYVDLGDVRVESRLAGKAPDAWRIGDAVRLVTGPLDPADPSYETFWFEPS
jgi:uncharacterized protein